MPLFRFVALVGRFIVDFVVAFCAAVGLQIVVTAYVPELFDAAINLLDRLI